jgi:hypothetical protein
MKRNLIKMIEDKKYNVVRVSRTEFELDNGDVYPHSFELDDDISIEEFQKLLDSSKGIMISLLKQIDEQ